MRQKGFSLLMIVIALAIVGVLGYLSYKFYFQKIIHPQVACTLEAKLCPDGSAVGRSGPKCEFAPCPTSDTSTWQTYTNPVYLFSFKYPKDYSLTGLDLAAPPGIFLQPNSYAGKTIDELIASPRISIEIMPRYTNVNDAFSYFQSSKSFKISNVTNIKLNNVNSIQFNLTNTILAPENTSFDVLILTGDGAVLHMSLSNYQNDQAVLNNFNQIISTYQPVNKVALIPADETTPAAGTCAQVQGKEVMIILNPDIPSPRCVIVSSEMNLSLINNTNTPITLDYGIYKSTIQPKSGYSFPGTIGSIFAPGVHRIMTSLYAGSGPEVWLK